jgi:hypothetical protein
MAEPGGDGALPTAGAATAVAERPAATPAVSSEGFSSSRMDGGLKDALRGYIGRSREVADMTRQASVSIDNLQPPKIPNLPAPPQTSTTDFATMFGSAAMSLAGLGSLMTRRPFTQALKSGAAVMDAYKKNDIQAAQQAFQTWQMETQNAMRMHQFEQEAYRNSIEKLKLKPEMARAELTALAASFKDEAALGMLNRGDVQGAMALITGRGRLGGSISTAQTELANNQRDFVDLQAARAELKRAEATGDLAAISAAQDQIDAVRQRAKDRAEIKNPLAFAKAENQDEQARVRAAIARKREERIRGQFKTTEERKAFDATMRNLRADRNYDFKTTTWASEVERKAAEFAQSEYRLNSQFERRQDRLDDDPAKEAKKLENEALEDLRVARLTGDPDEIERAKVRLADLRSGGRSGARGTLEEMRLDATTELLEARASGDPERIQKAEQALADVNTKSRSTANTSLTASRIIAQAATTNAEAEITRLTKAGKPPSPVEEAEIRQRALVEAEAKRPLPPAVRAAVEQKMNQAMLGGEAASDLIRTLENRGGGLSGLSGKLARGGESIWTILGGSSSVAANKFKTDISNLKGLVGQALSASAGRPLAADVKRVEALLDIDRIGRSAAIVHEALQAVEDLLYKQRQLDENRLGAKFDLNFKPKGIERRRLDGSPAAKPAAPAARGRKPDFTEYEPE